MKKSWSWGAAVTAIAVGSVLLPGVGGCESEANAADIVASRPEPQHRAGNTFVVGEELEYRVSYSFFTIGTIRFKITDKFGRNGRTVVRATALMDSNPALSWLAELHIRFYGEFDDEGFSYWWISDDSSASKVDYTRMAFDYQKKRLFYERGRKSGGGDRIASFRDSVQISGYSQDGMSLFFYARRNVRQQKQVRVPTFVDQKEGFTNINFTNERWSQEIENLDYPIETVRLDGKAEFTGVYGMTGGFEGWFTNDEASIPVTARMKVILGSVKIELKKWSRPGWQIPRYAE